MNFAFDKSAAITVNDQPFSICVDDAQLIALRSEMAEKVSKINPDDFHTLVDFSRRIEEVVDIVLGEGAYMKITNGLPVNTLAKMKFCAELLREASDILFNGLVEEND